jgi:hypothetical protein
VEVSEVAARLVRRYLPVLLLVTVIPMIAIGALVFLQPRTYTSQARLVVVPTLPRTQAEAAAAVSQADAVATSRDVIVEALNQAKVQRDPAVAVKVVTVTGLGSSALADVAYSDTDPAVAQKVAAALAIVVSARLNAIRPGLSDVLKVVDDELTALATERSTLQAQQKDPAVEVRINAYDRLMADLRTTRDRLAASSGTASGASAVVGNATLPDKPDSRGLPARLGLAGLLGLALGLILVGVNETFRPAVSGTFRVGRLLDVPVLGRVSAEPGAQANLGRRIRLAARRADATTVALVRVTGAALPPELVDRVEAATLRPQAVAHRVAMPNVNGENPIVGQGWGAGRQADDEITAISVLHRTEEQVRSSYLRRVCALDELDPSVESDQIGLVLLAGDSTRISSIEQVRDLVAASGWPLLGVVGDGTARKGHK